MITADDLPVFPACPTYGFASDTMILVKAVMREGGFETTDRKWDQALRSYNGTPIGDQPEADVEAILHFFLAVGGEAGRFRFKDFVDYKSARFGDAITPLDQPMLLDGDSPQVYRLFKRYQVGSFIHDRIIRRPRGDTIRVANLSGVEQATGSYTLDEATGILTPNGGFSGTPNTWGGEFDVYCRFTGPFVPEISNFQIQRADVNVREVRESS